MPVEKRVVAAAAFWRDTDPPEIAVQHAEAIGLLARRLNFRVRSLQALPIERRARHLAQMNEMTDAIATRALIAYHFEEQRPLMAAFLDALGIAHEDGLISEETLPTPDPDKLRGAAEELTGKYPEDQVRLYFSTLVSQDPETWKELATLAQTPAPEKP